MQTVLETAKSHWKPLETGHSLGRVNGTLEPPHERYGFLRFPMTVVGLQVGFHTVSTVSMRSSPFSFARAQSPGPARKACWRMVQNLHFATWSARTSFARAFWLVQPLRNPSEDRQPHNATLIIIATMMMRIATCSARLLHVYLAEACA